MRHYISPRPANRPEIPCITASENTSHVFRLKQELQLVCIPHARLDVLMKNSGSFAEIFSFRGVGRRAVSRLDSDVDIRVAICTEQQQKARGQ